MSSSDKAKTDAGLLRSAADLLAELGSYTSEYCAGCGGLRSEHLGTVDGVKVGCCDYCCMHQDPGCMRFTGRTVYVSSDVISRLRHIADSLHRPQVVRTAIEQPI